MAPQDAYYQQTDSNYYQNESADGNYYNTETTAIDPNYEPATTNNVAADYNATDYDPSNESQLTSDSRQYTDGSELARLDDNNSSMANYQSTSYVPTVAMQQQPSVRVDKIPNYLQSDTEDSQSGAATVAAAVGTAAVANVQSHVQPANDSDFDFSTNS